MAGLFRPANPLGTLIVIPWREHRFRSLVTVAADARRRPWVAIPASSRKRTRAKVMSALYQDRISHRSLLASGGKNRSVPAEPGDDNNYPCLAINDRTLT